MTTHGAQDVLIYNIFDERKILWTSNESVNTKENRYNECESHAHQVFSPSKCGGWPVNGVTVKHRVPVNANSTTKTRQQALEFVVNGIYRIFA